MKILSNQKRCLLTLALMLATCATIMAKAIIPFGKTEQKPWEGKFYYATIASGDTPGDDWYAADFDDFSWGTITGPIVNGTLSYKNTTWELANTTYWVRSHFTLTDEDLAKFFTFYIANDYTCEAYINGVQIYNVTNARNHSYVNLSDEQKAALKSGENVLAVKVSDTNGGDRYMDFGLYASDFNDAVARTDVPLSFTNDEENPWSVEAYNIIRRDNGKGNYESSLTMNYTSTYRTELSFDWRYDYQDGLRLYIDGVLAETCGTGHTYYNFGSRHFIIEPGEHVIVFRDIIGGSNANKISEIKNIKVKEIRPLETVLLTEKSLPLTFKNDDATHPWTLEDGEIQWCSWGVANSGAKISTTFTVDKTSKLQFDYKTYRSANNDYGDQQNLIIYLNGIKQNTYYSVRDYTTWTIALEPGDYTLEIEDTVYNRSDWYYSMIKNLELSNNWVNVELATPGTLGYEALSTPGINVLDDIEFLKVAGKMNDADWTDIKNMINLKALDLSEAIIDGVPNNAFDGKTLLNSVLLPEGATSIGEYAFRGTNIRRINIPSTVTIIKQYAFASTPIMYVTFADGSQLNTIEYAAFNTCTYLQEIALPAQLETMGELVFEKCSSMKTVTMGDAVTEIGRGSFATNTELLSIRFSDALEEMKMDMCSGCTKLNDVHLPANLKTMCQNTFYNTNALTSITFPATLELIMFGAFQYSALESVKLPINLTMLGEDAFSNNSNLKYIEMPSYIDEGSYYCWIWAHQGWGSYAWERQTRASGYRNNFRSCPNIETVVMRAATPPTINADPFASSKDKSVVTLVVPSFAVVNYKLDTYWKQFGSIIEGDDVDYWKITSPLMLTNNRRMQGTPDVDLYYNGQLTVGGAAPMTMDKFNMYFSEDNPGRLLNTCEDVSANEVTTKFSVAANKWYFITPIHDVNIADIDVSEGASYVFRYYDAENRAANGATGSWKNVDTSVLKGGQGYIFHCNKACVITFPADAEGQTQLFTTSDVTWNLTTNESTTPANRSWNYVGNPYPCYYDIYYMDFTAPITIWNGSTYKAYSIADDDLVLRPMQSFFVQKPEAVDKIVFNKEGRQLLSTVAPHTTSNSFTLGEQSRKIFNIQIADSESENAADETRVVLNNNANMGYELECDASKFMSLDNSVPQIFTTDSDGNAYAINERPALDGKVTLAFYAAKAGEYTISAQRADGKVQLIDSEEGNTVDITNESYTFGVDASSEANITRFTLVFSEKDATGTDEIKENINANVNVDTYDLMGRKTNATQPGIYVQGNVKVIK